MPKIITLTGVSGTGKSTIVEAQLKSLPGLAGLVLSTTTRQRRPGDLFGEYEYLSREKFYALREAGDFLWTTEAGGELYGTRKSILGASAEDKVWLMILTPDTVPILKGYMGKAAFSFYIDPPSEDMLRKRMQRRGDSEESIERRILQGRIWTEFVRQNQVFFDHFLENKTLADLEYAKMVVFNKILQLAKR